MPKYSYRKSSYKKKSYRKKGQMMIPRSVRNTPGFPGIDKGSRYDGINYIKIVDVTGMTWNDTLGMGAHTIQWGSNSIAVVNTNTTLFAQPEWTNLASKYRNWRIQGVKIQWDPIVNVTSGIGASAITRAQYTTFQGSIVDGATSATIMEQGDGYTTFDASKKFSRYHPCGQYFTSIGYPWQQQNTAAQIAGSFMRISAIGYAAGNLLGTVTTTWYVQLKQFNSTV